MSRKTAMTIAEACEKNPSFAEFVTLCENSIACWIENINVANNAPSIIPRTPRYPANMRISILLPIIPISPNETELLLRYLEKKYLNPNIIAGDYFKLRKCLFKNNYKLTSKCYSDYDEP